MCNSLGFLVSKALCRKALLPLQIKRPMCERANVAVLAGIGLCFGMVSSAELLKDPAWQVFADTYLVTNNITESAIKAGYSERSARTTGRRLLQKAPIAAYIQKAIEARSAKTLSTKDKIKAELERMAFFNIEDVTTVDDEGNLVPDFSNAGRDQLAAVTSLSSVTKTRRGRDGTEEIEKRAKYGFADKYRGMELLAKLEGLLKEDKVHVVVDVADRLLQARQRVLALDTEPHDED